MFLNTVIIRLRSLDFIFFKEIWFLFLKFPRLPINPAKNYRYETICLNGYQILRLNNYLGQNQEK